MKRGSSGLSGVLAIDKPAGMTSHDVVNRVRRATGERRVGHAGTLDPAATGLLVVCVGPATRLSPYLTGHDKAYRARVAFGSATATDDAQGEVVRRAPVPARLANSAFAAQAVAGLVGPCKQVPPAYSAIKREGKKAYEVARSGGVPELEAREVTIRSAELLGVGGSTGSGPDAGGVWWDVRLAVSKGTYVRSIARDLGESLGTAAHLASLAREKSGALSLADASSLDEVEKAGAAGREAVEGLFCDPVAALGLPEVEVGPQDAVALAQGRRLAAPPAARGLSGRLVAVTSQGRLLSVHRVEGGRLVAQCVINGGVSGCKRL